MIHSSNLQRRIMKSFRHILLRIGFRFDIDLSNTDGSRSQRHAFHVHDNPILNGQCDSAGDIYHPLCIYEQMRL